MSDYLIETHELNKTFTSSGTQNDILKNINLSVNQGDFIAIEGPSGGGKSTLLSILGLLDTASSGDYILCGQNIKTLSNYQLSVLRNQHIGWIFQNFNLVGDMTVSENIMMPLRYHEKITKSQYPEKINTVLEKVGIAEHANKYPAQLSGGQQQRAAIARALVTAPSLILADEPTGNLDSANTTNVLQLLQSLNNEGTTIIIITHDAEVATQCHKKLYLHDGQLAQSSQIPNLKQAI